jgi:thiol-disulfide isomerase/thioredoxin
MPRYWTIVMLTAIAPAPVAAQASMQVTAALCRTVAMDWYVRQTNAAVIAAGKAGGPPVDALGLLSARNDRQRGCLLTIDLPTAQGPELAALAKAYTSVGLDSLAFVAATRRLTEVRGGSDSERANALNGVISTLAMAEPAKLARAESYVAILDALSDTVRQQKMLGHRAVKAAYIELDDVVRIRYHAVAIITLARGHSILIQSARAPAINRSVLDAYTDLVQLHDETGHVDSALSELAQIVIDHPEARGPELDRITLPEERRLQLVGTPAADIVAPHWLNTDTTTRSISPAGKVTVIEFSATWCEDCKATYPVLNSLAGRFPGADLRLLLATELYGRVPGGPPGELAFDHEFFVDKYGVRFPIAISDRLPRASPRDTMPASSNDARYAVYGIPQIVVIDRRGTIRRVVSGWGAGDAGRLETLLTALLAEKH